MRFSFTELERLFVSHHRTFFIAALSITKDRAAAEDAVHDALLSVNSLADRPDDLKAYMFKVVRNNALKQLKQARRFTDENTADEFLVTDSLDQEKTVLATQVLRHIEVLDKNTQQVLIMKLFADLSFKEIAEIMGSPANTVASWYRRGLLQLKEKLNEHE